MSYYHICPECGAHLDPGEECDCQKETDPECTYPTTTMYLPGTSGKMIDSFVSTAEYLRMKKELTASFRG